MNCFDTAVRMATVGVLMTFVGSVAAQQDYPSKPIRIITPYVAGGSTTVLARLVGQKLTESWGQQVIVDNRGGGDTIIGSDVAAKSPPDGYTILLAGTTLVMNASLYSKLPYDTFKDFAPIAALTSYEIFLSIHPSLPANNLQEFIAFAKSRPGQLNYATTGTTAQLAAELFNNLAGTKIQHIPYKGGGQSITDVVAGQVQLTFCPATNVIGHVKNGRLKGIAISGKKRLSALPQVPTFSEAGLPGYDVTTWYGLLAPAGTPKEIVDKVSAEIARILALPDLKQKLDSQGFDPLIYTADEFAALMKADYAKYAKIIKTANIKLNN